MSSWASASRWNAVSQATAGAVALFLPPVAIRAVGAPVYGTIAVVLAAAGMLAALDLGATDTVLRFAANSRLSTRSLLRFVLRRMAGLVAVGVTLAATYAWVASGGGPVDSSLIGGSALVLTLALVASNILCALLIAVGLARRMAFSQLGVAVVFVGWLIGVGRASLTGEQLLFGIAAYHLSRALALYASARGALALRAGGAGPDRRDLRTFARRSQATTVWGAVNLQADTLIAGFLLGGADAAVIAAATTATSLFRRGPSTLLAPLVAELSAHQGDGRAFELRVAVRHRAWLTIVAGTAVIGVPAVALFTGAWVGGALPEAVPVVAALTAASVVNLATGSLSALARATGRPEVEARAGGIAASTNVALTFLLTPSFGLTGLVAATAAGQLFGSVWFFRRMQQPDVRMTRPIWQDVPWRASVIAASPLLAVASLGGDRLLWVGATVLAAGIFVASPTVRRSVSATPNT